MDPEVIPPTQEVFQNPADFSILRPQIVKSIIILEINNKKQNKFDYALGVICPENKILFSTNYDHEKINKYYVFKDIPIEVYYHQEITSTLDIEQNLTLIEEQSQDFGFEAKPNYLTWQSFAQDILPKASQTFFLQEIPKLGQGFIIRIENDKDNHLSLRISPFYGRPQGLAYQCQSGLIFIQPKNDAGSFYGFCQVYMQYFRYDMMFRLSSLQTYSNNELLVNTDQTSMMSVNKVIQFPYDSIGLLSKGLLYGTASVLLNSDRKTSKFLITCAHNFINQFDKPDKCQMINISDYKFKLAKELTENNPNFKQCRISDDEKSQLSIKTVHFHPKLIEYIENRKKNQDKIVYKYYEYLETKQRLFELPFQKMYDIAIVELIQPIPVWNGFRLKQVAKEGYYSVLDKLEVAGFPAGVQHLGTKHGIMYHQAVENHKTEKDKCFKIRKLEKKSDFLFICHKLSTLPGNSGSPIFQKLSQKQSNLLGIHTMGCGSQKIQTKKQVSFDNNKVYGLHNAGVYIYNKEIFDWIKEINGISEVFEKKISEIIYIIKTNKDAYIIGVLYSQNQILTLKKYVQDDDYPIMVFKKGQNNSYEEYQTENIVEIADNTKLVKIKIKNQSNLKLKNEIEISTQQENQNSVFDSGYILSVGKQDIYDHFEINETPFASGLPALQLTGVLFVRNKAGKICLNGFYDNDSTRKLNGSAAVVPINKPQKIQLRKRFMEAEPEKNIEEYPYTSIGILRKKEGRYCTASILHNENPNKPGFIITSASFFSQDQNDKHVDPQKCNCSNYIFTYGLNSTTKKIRNILIHPQYNKNINTPFQLIYDVAIIQLQENFHEVNGGLRIMRKKMQRQINANNIQVAGYLEYQQGGKKKKTLFYDTTRKQSGWTILISYLVSQTIQAKFIKHRFDLLQGQTGLPIFENVEKGKSYLIGIQSYLNKDSKQNIATYLYFQPIYDWISNIKGLQLQPQKTFESSLLNKISPFGVFQIFENNVLVDYGIGIVHRENLMVTLKNYLKNGRKIGRIFFKKLSGDDKFPISYDLNIVDHSKFIIANQEERQEQINRQHNFVNILLDREISNLPLFIKEKDKNSIHNERYSISFEKSKQRNILLHWNPYRPNSSKIQQKYNEQTSILFALLAKNYFCYGFKDNFEGNGQMLLTKDQLQQSKLINTKNDIFTAFEAVQNPFEKVPFQSIGILQIPNGSYATAQLLQDPKGCKYLITCASNFLHYYYNLLPKCAQFTFKLPKIDMLQKTFKYKLQKVRKFKIKRVHIPNEYIQQFSRQKKGKNKKIQVKAPELLSSQEHNQQITIDNLYNIAVIELADRLDETHGFIIDEEDKPITGPVQITGFPSEYGQGRLFGIRQGLMYMESTASYRKDPTQIQRFYDSEGNTILRHKLFTLPGSGGSPIYERISDQECRLLGVHTTRLKKSHQYRMKDNPQFMKEELLKDYKLATHIQSKQIKEWLRNILKQ